MSERFDQVKDYVLELGLVIDQEIPEEEIVIVNDQDRGIQNLVIDCEDDVLVLEQLIMESRPNTSAEVYKRILQMNRGLVYGAFVLNEDGSSLI